MEICRRNYPCRSDGVSRFQSVELIVRWSRSNKLQLNVDKSKELMIDLKSIRQSLVPIPIIDKDLDYVKEVKILGRNISNNLLWNNHISDMIKRLYFLILLKRAKLPSNDILDFYCTCVRPVLEYCAPVFQHSLLAYLCNGIERVQMRALSGITPGSKFIPRKSISIYVCTLIKERRSGLREKLFTSVKLEKITNSITFFRRLCLLTILGKRVLLRILMLVQIVLRTLSFQQ